MNDLKRASIFHFDIVIWSKGASKLPFCLWSWILFDLPFYSSTIKTIYNYMVKINIYAASRFEYTCNGKFIVKKELNDAQMELIIILFFAVFGSSFFSVKNFLAVYCYGEYVLMWLSNI